MPGSEYTQDAGRRLDLEPLEERIAPAGNVVVNVSGGNLTITGDDEANSLVIDQAMLPDGRFRVTPSPGTTINGFGDTAVFTGVKGIKMSLGGGDDQVVLNGVTIAKDVTANGGAGEDNVLFAGGALVQGALMLSDVDHAMLSGTVIVRGAKITYSTDGNYSFVMDNSHVMGDCSIANRGQDMGSDYLFSDSMVWGNLTLSNKTGAYGPGQATVLSIAGSSVGNINVKAGTGDYVFSFSNSLTLEHKGSINLAYGVGHLTTVFDTSTVNGSVSLKVAGGLTAIPYTTAFMLQNDSTITGRLTIKTGDSDDTISMHKVGIGGERIAPGKVKTFPSTISQSTNGWAFDGDVTSIHIDTAEIGKLAIKLRPQDSYVGFNRAGVIAGLSITGQGGDDLITFRGVRMLGTTSVKSGGGNDIICFDESDLTAALVIDTGAGVDTVRMDTDVDNVVGEYGGPVKITLGTGDDTLIVGNSGLNGNSGRYFMPLVVDGSADNDEIDYMGHPNVFDVAPRVVGFENIY